MLYCLKIAAINENIDKTIKEIKAQYKNDVWIAVSVGVIMSIRLMNQGDNVAGSRAKPKQ
jgi:hypothetical protein